MILTLLLSLAWADGPEDPNAPSLAADGFRPSVSAERSLAVEDARPVEGVGGRLTTVLSHRTLLYTVDEDVTKLVNQALAVHASAWWSTPRVRLGASAPMYLLSTGDIQGLKGPVMGDPSLDARVLLRPELDAPLGLAVVARVTAPLGAHTRQLGLPGYAGELGLVVDYKADRFWLAGNLGGKLAPEIDLGEQLLNDQLILRAGGGVIFAPECGLGAELVSGLTPSALGVDPTAQATELSLTAWTLRDSGVELRGGLGTALGPGIGSPRLRVVLGVGFRPPRSAE
ncbi:MAG: hypothetical protein H6740_12195 [Alphaproteobacteria bacterium]|nr:hypothetical protein [Alphaproteobacteria bacterium]